MELSTILFNKQKTIHFIKDHFQDVSSLDEIERIFHPMGSVKFNKGIKYDHIQYTIYGKPIEMLFAFYNQIDKDKYAIYLILDIPKSELKMFSKVWGNPMNVPSEDYETGDFDSQIWNIKGLDVIVGRSFIYGKSNDSQLIHISNIKLPVLYGIE